MAVEIMCHDCRLESAARESITDRLIQRRRADRRFHVALDSGQRPSQLLW